MAIADDILIRINAQDNGASAALRNVGQAAEKSLGAGSGLAAYAGTATKALVGLGGVMTAGALVSGLKDMVTRTAEVGDKLIDMSQRTGIAVRDLGGLSIGARQTGTSLETVEGALRRLVANAAAAKDPLSEQGKLFASMGISVTTVNGQLRPARDLLAEVAEKLRTTRDATERMAIAQNLLGKSGSDLIPMLAGGAAGLAEFQAKAEAAGVALSEQAADDIAKYNDAMDDLETSWQGIGNLVGATAIPILTRLTNEGLKPALEVIRSIVGQTPGDQGSPLPRLATVIKTVDTNTDQLTSRYRLNESAARLVMGSTASFASTAVDASAATLTVKDALTRTTSQMSTSVPTIDLGKSKLGQYKAEAEGAATETDKLKSSTERLRPEVRGASTDLDHFDDMLGWVAGTGQDGRGGLEGVDQGLKDIIDTSGDVNLDDIAFPPMAAWVKDVGTLDQGLKDLDATASKIDLSDIAPPKVESFRGFAQSLGQAFTEPMGKQVIQTSLIGAFTDIAQGGSFKDAAGQVGVAIGGAIGGPAGAAVAGALTNAIFGSFTATDFTKKTYAGIGGEAIAAFKQGGVGMLESTDLRRKQRDFKRAEGQAGQGIAQANAIDDFARELQGNLDTLTFSEARTVAEALLTGKYYGKDGEGINAIIKAALIRDYQRADRVNQRLAAIAEEARSGTETPSWTDTGVTGGTSGSPTGSPPPGGNGSAPPPAASEPSPPPAARPAAPDFGASTLTPLKIAKDLLTQGLADGSLSRKALQTIGAATITQAVTEMGGFWPQLGSSLRGAIAGSPQDDTFLRSRGIAITARQGMWRVPGAEHEAYPAILHGQERVLTAAQTKAMDAGLGQFEGSAGPVMIFHNYVTAMDGRDMDDYVTRRMGPSLQRFVQAQTRRGVKMVNSRGVLTPPTT